MNPNHFLAVAIEYLYTHRPEWSADAAVGVSLGGTPSNFTLDSSAYGGSAVLVGGAGNDVLTSGAGNDFDDRVAELYLGPTLTARLRARLEAVA